ncbi:MAG: DUF190 domain-containing protein, partial [Solirubrobacteraceae bacterium]
YHRHRIHTSVLLRGIDGFGPSHHLHTDRLLTMSENLPAVSIAIDTRERIEGALPEVLELAAGGLISLERATLAGGDGLPALKPPGEPGSPVKLTVYGGRGVRADGNSGYVRAVARLAEAGVLGAAVLLAVDGMLHGERRRGRFFARNAQVPLMLLAIGAWESLEPVLPEITALLENPVVTVEKVRICKLAGAPITEPLTHLAPDDSGLPSWQKLTVHVEEQAMHDGEPVHVELVRRLREAGAAGATALRGVRGFYGDREPAADRVWSLRRRAPVSVIVIDTPAAVARWWPIVDELTHEHGLVTSEIVPASHGLGVTALALDDARAPRRSP